jgi:hypothetical protein
MQTSCGRERTVNVVDIEALEPGSPTGCYAGPVDAPADGFAASWCGLPDRLPMGATG